MERVKFRAKSEQVGTVASVFVSTGDEVLKDDKLFSILMGDSELIVKSHTSGTIQDVYVTEEEPITDKGLLCDILTTEETLNMDEEPIFKTSEAIISEQEEPKFSLKHTDFNDETSTTTDSDSEDFELFNEDKKQLKDVIEQIDDDAFVSELLRKKTKASIKNSDHNRGVVDSLDEINEKITEMASNEDSVELSRIFLKLRSDLLAIINSWQNVYDNFDEYSKQNDNKFKQVEDRISSNNKRIYGEHNKLKIEFEKNLNEHISNSDSNVKNIRDRINAINSNLNRINTSIAEIIKKSEDDILLDAKYDDSQILSKIKTLTDSVNTITTKYDYLQSLLDSSTNSYDDQKIIDRIKTMSESINSLKTKIDLMGDENTIASLEQKLVSSISTNKIFREKIESKISKIEESLESNSSDRLGQNLDFDTNKFVTKEFLDNKIDSSIRELKLKNSSNSLELDVDDFVTKEKLNAKINSLREDFDEKVKDYKKVSYSGNDLDISKYTTKVYLEDKLDDLRHDIKVVSNHTRKIEILEDKIEKLDRFENKIEKLESKIEVSPSIDKIESKIEKFESKLDKMPKDNSDKIEKLESKLEKYKDAIKSNKSEISELKKIIKKLLSEKETSIKTVVPKIEAPTIIEDVNVRVREYTRLYDLNDIFTYYNEMNFNLKSIESNVRIDFIIYKAITNALFEKNFLSYDDITIGKITSNVMRFKKLVIADKTLEFMYENQNSIAKKTDEMGTVVVIDSKIEDKILKLFKSSPKAKLLIVFMGSRKTDNSNKSILLKYYIKTSVNEEDMISFLDDLDLIIPNPEQMK